MNIDSTIAEKNVSIATEYYKLMYSNGFQETIINPDKRTYTGGGTGFIPFKVSFTLDGISGFKIYQKLRVNSSFLPFKYAKTLDFIITGLNHKLSNNDWETNVECVVIPKFEDYDEIITTGNFTYVKPPTIQTTSPSTNGNSNPSTDKDLWILLAIMSREGVGGQSRIDVVQSIINRAGSGQYRANNIYELITAKSQYEPAFADNNGNVAQEWKNVKDFNTAKIALNYTYKTLDKKAYTLQDAKNSKYNTLDEFLGARLKQAWLDLKNTTYTTNAANFIQGRVDFKAPNQYGNNPANADASRRSEEAKKRINTIFPTERVNNVWRGTNKDNIFGWMYNYIENKVYPFPSVTELDKLKNDFDSVIIK